MILLKNIFLNEPISVIVQNKPETFTEWLSNPNTIIAISALLISLSGLYLSVRYNRKTLNETMKYNKLSVEPLLLLSMFTIDEKLTINLENAGLGSANLLPLEITHNNQTYNSFWTLLQPFIQNIKNEIEYYDHYTFNTNTPLSASNKIDLINITFKTNQTMKSIASELNGVNVKIRYKTMYNEERVLNEKLMLNI